VHSHVCVSLLISVVLSNVVEIISSDDDGVGHLPGRVDNSLQNSSSDGNVSSEGALLVDVGSLDGFLGGLKAKTNGLIISESILCKRKSSSCLLSQGLASAEFRCLLLVSTLVLSDDISHRSKFTASRDPRNIAPPSASAPATAPPDLRRRRRARTLTAVCLPFDVAAVRERAADCRWSGGMAATLRRQAARMRGLSGRVR